MNNEMMLVVIALLLLLVGEVTYLVTKLPRVTAGKRRMILVDTSVLIDGRILSVASSGFIGDVLVIPRSVIGELQFLADNADHDKRMRARHGLDVVKELQEMPNVEVAILQDGSKAAEGVDERLLTLAKKHNGVIATIDYNLNKVAVVEGIVVLNINELAQTLRMAYLPGEKMLLEIVQKGQDSHQGVGYLKDGTMVVVEHASSQLNKKVEIEFIRSLQTQAGKMMFARLVGKAQAPKQQQAPKEKLVASVETKDPRKTHGRRQAKPQQQPQPQAQAEPQTIQPPQAQPKQAPRNKPNTRSRSQTISRSEDALIELAKKQ